MVGSGGQRGKTCVDHGIYMLMIYAMKRTTMFIDEELLARLQRLAHRKGVSYATLVREALAQYLANPRSAGSLPSIAGRFSSGTTDTSERVDDLLWRDPHQ